MMYSARLTTTDGFKINSLRPRLYPRYLRCCTIVNKPFMNGPESRFHKKIYSSLHRPESLFLKMVQDVSCTAEFKTSVA